MGQEVRTVLNGSKVSTETLAAKGGDTLKGLYNLSCLSESLYPDPKAKGINYAIIQTGYFSTSHTNNFKYELG